MLRDYFLILWRAIGCDFRIFQYLQILKKNLIVLATSVQPHNHVIIPTVQYHMLLVVLCRFQNFIDTVDGNVTVLCQHLDANGKKDVNM